MRKGPAHRGAAGDMALFAQRFLEARFVGFMKDIEICLTGRPADWRPGLTYAYFPALMACCGTLEYLACMYHGRQRCNDDLVAVFAAEFMPQPAYDAEAIRLLFEGFRHKVAHHGIASGVWHDRRHHRKVTWAIGPDRAGPALQLHDDARDLLSDPPWPCQVTHTAEIHLGCLASDIQLSALGEQGYAHALQTKDELISSFVRCMHTCILGEKSLASHSRASLSFESLADGFWSFGWSAKDRFPWPDRQQWVDTAPLCFFKSSRSVAILLISPVVVCR